MANKSEEREVWSKHYPMGGWANRGVALGKKKSSCHVTANIQKDHLFLPLHKDKSL